MAKMSKTDKKKPIKKADKEADLKKKPIKLFVSSVRLTMLILKGQWG